MTRFPVERLSCVLCGATTGLIRLEMFRYLVFEPGHEYDAGPRCVDRVRCQADVEALHEADPEHNPRWNVADGPAAMPRQATQRALAARATPAPAPSPESDPLPPEPPRGEVDESAGQLGVWQ